MCGTIDNPCKCLGDQIVNTPPKPCPPNDISTNCCIGACGGVISCDNGAVGPCGKVGTTDLKVLPHNLEGCKEDPIFRLISYDKSIFVSASLTTEGILTWVTKDVSTVGRYGNIEFTLECGGVDDCPSCITLKDSNTISIGIKDECRLNTCEECEECNPCTGLCEDKDVSISVGESCENSNIKVNG